MPIEEIAYLMFVAALFGFIIFLLAQDVSRVSYAYPR